MVLNLKRSSFLYHSLFSERYDLEMEAVCCFDNYYCSTKTYSGHEWLEKLIPMSIQIILMMRTKAVNLGSALDSSTDCFFFGKKEKERLFTLIFDAKNSLHVRIRMFLQWNLVVFSFFSWKILLLSFQAIRSRSNTCSYFVLRPLRIPRGHEGKGQFGLMHKWLEKKRYTIYNKWNRQLEEEEVRRSKECLSRCFIYSTEQ